MADWTCDECGKTFQRSRSGKRPIRFCSQECYHQWNRKSGENLGRFTKGLTPWNKGTKGIMKANRGTFQKGRISERKQPIGGMRIRRDKGGHDRVWMKVTDNGNPYDWKLRAVVVWERWRGLVSHGMIVHHKDRDTLNDKISNLLLVIRAEHLKIHRPEFEEKRSKAASKATKQRHARDRAAL